MRRRILHNGVEEILNKHSVRKNKVLPTVRGKGKSETHLSGVRWRKWKVLSPKEDGWEEAPQDSSEEKVEMVA